MERRREIRTIFLFLMVMLVGAGILMSGGTEDEGPVGIRVDRVRMVDVREPELMRAPTSDHGFMVVHATMWNNDTGSLPVGGDDFMAVTDAGTHLDALEGVLQEADRGGDAMLGDPYPVTLAFEVPDGESIVALRFEGSGYEATAWAPRAPSLTESEAIETHAPLYHPINPGKATAGHMEVMKWPGMPCPHHGTGQGMPAG